MTKAVVLVVLGLTALAQAFPSCGSSEVIVIGWVEAKFRSPFHDAYIIEINNVEYSVPQDFWELVGVGDLVKFEGGVWKIVRKRGT